MRSALSLCGPTPFAVGVPHHEGNKEAGSALTRAWVIAKAPTGGMNERSPSAHLPGAWCGRVFMLPVSPQGGHGQGCARRGKVRSGKLFLLRVRVGKATSVKNSVSIAEVSFQRFYSSFQFSRAALGTGRKGLFLRR